MDISSPKKRNVYWDNIKGILILLVVFAHILFQLQDRSLVIDKLVNYIYMFHMPAFVFVSGFFGKSEHSRSFESIIKLIFLYFVFNSIMGFIYGFNSLLQPVYSYWYLIALIVWRLTTHHIAKFKEILLILFIVSLFAGFYPSVDNTFSAARIICFFPFYMTGYLLSEEKSSEFVNKNYLKRISIGIILLICSGALAFASNSYFKYSDDSLQMAAYSTPSDSFGRIVLYIVAFTGILAFRYITPDKKIPFLTKFGCNSLWIFILHRPITFLISDHIGNMQVPIVILISVISSLIICLIFGSDIVNHFMNLFLDRGTEIFTKENNNRLNFSKITALAVSLWFIVSVVIDSYAGVSVNDLKKFFRGEKIERQLSEDDDSENIRYPIMTDEQREAFTNAFRITFSGDLILLEDQVKRGYNGNGYDFSDVFEYAEPYISSADLAIGVFEGPMAGDEAGYSSGNFDDEKDLFLNFPDEFASAVQKAGFDLVTNANNHLLDKDESGALRTIDILDKIGLEHTGSYKDPDDKKNNHIKIINCQGIKFAVLSYTYGSNYIDNSELIDGNYSYLTSVISGTEGEQFEKLKKIVENDFREAKAQSPDLIIVLPHIGTQFSNQPDAEQHKWFNIFKENGADIILGDHPHVVEPAIIENYNGKYVFTAYCPGNFANIYRDDQGDTSILTDVYIDRNTKKVIGGSIVPLYTHARADGNFRAVPIYDIMTDLQLREQLTTDDIERAALANDIITDVVFGHKMDISSVTERYYFNEDGFIRSKASGLILTDDMKKGTLYQAVSKSKSICFIGDSVTEGTKNGGCPWYEPIEEYLTDKKIYNISQGGATISYFSESTDQFPAADLYIIAVGTNDVRYRNEDICAMTSKDYIDEIDILKNKLMSKSSNAEYIFIAPWYSVDGDPYCDLTFSEKTSLNEEYSSALQEYCLNNSAYYINANEYIKNMLKTSPDRLYLLDHIHPNASKGVIMYSEAVLSYGSDQ